jgi:hypothetical protein
VATVSALFGTGVYGASEYGVINVSASISGVFATGSVQSVSINGFEIDVSERITIGVAGTGSVGSVIANTAAGLTGVVGTFTLNGAGLDVRSINRVPITSTSMTGSIGAPEPQVLEKLNSVSAAGSVNTLTVNITEKLASASATGSIGTLAISNSFSIVGVSATGFVNTVSENIDENLNGVSATTFVGSLSVNISEKLVGVQGTSSVNLPAPSDAITVFSAAAFDPKNVVFVTPNAFRLKTVNTSAAADAFDRTRVVTVLPIPNRKAA